MSLINRHLFAVIGVSDRFIETFQQSQHSPNDWIIGDSQFTCIPLAKTTPRKCDYKELQHNNKSTINKYPKLPHYHHHGHSNVSIEH